VDPSTGDTYYFHEESGVTQWDPPQAASDGRHDASDPYGSDDNDGHEAQKSIDAADPYGSDENEGCVMLLRRDAADPFVALTRGGVCVCVCV
jgi:hypothetical protein